LIHAAPCGRLSFENSESRRPNLIRIPVLVGETRGGFLAHCQLPMLKHGRRPVELIRCGKRSVSYAKREHEEAGDRFD
jgi:hypothetical protein